MNHKCRKKGKGQRKNTGTNKEAKPPRKWLLEWDVGFHPQSVRFQLWFTFLSFSPWFLSFKVKTLLQITDCWRGHHRTGGTMWWIPCGALGRITGFLFTDSYAPRRHFKDFSLLLYNLEGRVVGQTGQNRCQWWRIAIFWCV